MEIRATSASDAGDLVRRMVHAQDADRGLASRQDRVDAAPRIGPGHQDHPCRHRVDRLERVRHDHPVEVRREPVFVRDPVPVTSCHWAWLNCSENWCDRFERSPAGLDAVERAPEPPAAPEPVSYERKPYAPAALGEIPPHFPTVPPPVSVSPVDNYQHVTNLGTLLDVMA